jgi:cysteine desulfurase
VLTPIEHSCVLHAAAAHEASGGVLTRLPVEESGRVVLSDLEPGPATALVSVQSANQEIGTRQPIAEVAERCRAAGVPLHVDAAQSVGREPVSVRDWGCQLLTASAHKFGGPSGVGLLVIREGTRWERPGPDDDRGDARVSGPLDVPAAVATAAALVARTGEIGAENPRLAALGEQIRRAVQAIPDAQVHGDPDPAGRLPHLVSMSFLYVDGEALLDRLAAHGVAAASGSACTASSLSPSHVLEAIGALTHGNLRVSLGRSSSQEDVDRLLNVLPDAVAALRAEAGAQGL